MYLCTILCTEATQTLTQAHTDRHPDMVIILKGAHGTTKGRK